MPHFQIIVTLDQTYMSKIQTQLFMSSTYARPALPLKSSWIRFVLGIYLLIITYKSIAPAGFSSSMIHMDKVMHMMAFTGLTILVGLAWPRLPLIWVLGLTAFYGVSVEIIQATTPYGRTGSVWDMMANLAGILLIIFGWIIICRLRNYKPH